MNNKQRAKAAKAALVAYIMAKRDVCESEAVAEVGIEKDAVVTDLITDLLHFAAAQKWGQDRDEVLHLTERAKGHFNTEAKPV